MPRSRAFVSLAVVLLLLSTTGCLGRFAMSSAARRFNLDIVGDQWGREIVFIVMYVIPVYPVCAFGDLFIVNSIEFWEGENPLSGEQAITLTKEDSVESPADSIAVVPQDATRDESTVPSLAGAGE